MSSTIEMNGNRGIITLDGDLTLADAKTFRTHLIKALIDSDEVTVRFGDVAAVDLSCIQLLCSAHRSAVRLNKRLALQPGWPERFQQVAQDAGFSRSAGCRLDMQNSCLWTGR